MHSASDHAKFLDLAVATVNMVRKCMVVFFIWLFLFVPAVAKHIPYFFENSPDRKLNLLIELIDW